MEWSNDVHIYEALPDMIAFHVMRILGSVDRQIDWIHSQNIWVSGYKQQLNNPMTRLFMKHYLIWLPLM